MTDKLIERIKTPAKWGGTCTDSSYVREMEARILVDAKIIKAAQDLADMYDSLLGNVERLQEFNLDGDFMVLAAYRATTKRRLDR